MKDKILLLDTCAFIRLASFKKDLFTMSINIRGESYKIKVHQEVKDEMNDSMRLTHKFFLAEFPAITKNDKLNISSGKKKLLPDQYSLIDYTADYLDFNPPTPSPIDKICLAYQCLLRDSVITVTDDKKMAILANHLKLQTYSSIDILFFMFEDGYITLDDFARFKEHLISLNDWMPYFESKMQDYIRLIKRR